MTTEELLLSIPDPVSQQNVEIRVAFESDIRKRNDISDPNGVLVIYTGGTIGSVPSDDNNMTSPRVMGSWRALRNSIPYLSIDTFESVVPFPVDSASFQPPINSADMGCVHWVAIAEIIELFYDRYQGFVVIHGTDTLSFTASAISFILSGLSKPVVVTGSQRSIVSDQWSDGYHNLLMSLLIANAQHSGICVVPEVSILFQNKLLRANRSVKAHSTDFDCFASPNHPPLASIGSQIEVNGPAIWNSNQKDFRIQNKLDSNIFVIDLFPGIQQSKLFKAIENVCNVRGIVVRSYGAGNASTNKQFLSEIQKLTDAGVVMVSVSQCLAGGVDHQKYETGTELLAAGVIDGGDMTTDAAFTKLATLLGDTSLNTTQVREIMSRSIRGEISESNLD